MSGWVLTGPIRYTGHADLQRDIANFKAAASGTKAGDLFMAAVAPASVAPDRKDEFYKSDEDYVFAVAEALRDEYKAIVDAGLILQIDDAYLAHTYEVMVPPKTARDYRKWAAVRIEALNHALKGLPIERTRYHVCWGSWTDRTRTMSSSKTSSISSSKCAPAVISSKWPIRATNTNGACGSA
jgi:5-methyltetrahydropteroyltriglutamate--homocysteine methyltransferase